MSDHDALLRAICDHPDDDTPRLIFADFLEENGDADRAAFVRAQVELARTPAWEPFAVYCRHRRPEWSDGAPWRHTLPPLGLPGLEWPPAAFRRGLGWCVDVKSPPAWMHAAPRVYEQAPVGELYLNTSATTLDELREFAAADWVRFLRVVHLDGASPVEPTRVLCAAPAATGITDIHFHRASSAGLPELIEGLMESRLGRSLRGLHFYVGYEAIEELVEALAAGGNSTRLERLSFTTMGLTPEAVRRLVELPVLDTVTDLSIRNDRLGSEGVELLCRSPRVRNLTRLVLSGAQVGPSGWAALAESPHLSGLRALDLGGSSMSGDELEGVLLSRHLIGLRSFSRRGYCGDWDVRAITRMGRFWTNLVELDLRTSWQTHLSAKALVAEPAPPELTALLLDPHGLDTESVQSLRRYYGERLVLSDRDA